MATDTFEGSQRRSAAWRARASAGVAALVALLLALAGCGGAGKGGAGKTASGVSTAALTGPGTEITVKRVPKAGIVLAAGPRKRTVYEFERDPFYPATSACLGRCETIWPPVVTKGRPLAGRGAAARLLGTAKRSNGSLQVTYNGHRLYYFSGDRRLRDILGEGAEGLWYVLAPEEGIGILVRGKLP